MIILTNWPDETEKTLMELYENVDQSNCLVTVNISSHQQTENYIRIIKSGDNDGKPFLCRAVCLDDQLIGKAELTRYDDNSAELDIVLRREYCGRGYGTKAVVDLVYTVIGMNWCSKIRAYVSAANKPAGRMLMKVGFKPLRKFKADIMVPAENTYSLKEQDGYEFILEIPEITVS